MAAGFDIINWITFPNQSFLKVKLGWMDPQALEDKEFSINAEAIKWHNMFNQVGFNYDMDRIGPKLSFGDLVQLMENHYIGL